MEQFRNYVEDEIPECPDCGAILDREWDADEACPGCGRSLVEYSRADYDADMADAKHAAGEVGNE